ncbi:MAG: hypothetical protein QXM83_02855 [Ignisphaera sp.]
MGRTSFEISMYIPSIPLKRSKPSNLDIVGATYIGMIRINEVPRAITKAFFIIAKASI